MIDGVNDADWQADLLAKHLRGMPGHVNLIGLNHIKESPLHSWVLYDGADYSKTYLYCSGVQILILAGILLSVLGNFLGRGEIKEIQAMQIAVFGLFLFLLIWETRSRYLVNFVPVFFLLGIDGTLRVRDLAAVLLRKRLTENAGKIRRVSEDEERN